jgi:hypothetical protein
VLVHAFALLCLGSFILPGIVLWLPVWALVLRQERRLRKRGHFWLDSVAESKMIISFFAIIGYLVVFNVFAPLLLVYSWFGVRAYEGTYCTFVSRRLAVWLGAIVKQPLLLQVISWFVRNIHRRAVVGLTFDRILQSLL